VKNLPTITTLALATLLAGCTCPTKELDTMDSLTLLKKNDITLGMLPQAGGRPVFLQIADGGNILSADASLWSNAETIGRKSVEENGWTGFNGHIFWIGPQSAFWSDQDIQPELRGEPWPPDPYVTLLPFEVTGQSDSTIHLKSQDSPVSGLRIDSSYELLDVGHIRIQAQATNIRETAVSKDLWSNTRVYPDSHFFVPIADESQVRIDTLGAPALPTEYADGFFRFDNDGMQADAAWANKAFIYPRLPYIAKFLEKHVFIKRFDSIPADRIHPEQGAVEIYLDVPRKGYPGLLELEAHSAYGEIAPSASTSWNEDWLILPYEGPEDPAAQRAFLRKWESTAFAP